MGSYFCANPKNTSGPSGPDPIVEQLRRHLGLISFFHLGADAVIEVLNSEGGFIVAIDHARIRPVRVSVSFSEARHLLSDRSAFEEFFLNQLTRHRRS